MTGEVDGEVGVIGEAAVVRPGSAVTLVSAMRTLHECLAAAETLAGEGTDCEVIDVRTMRPLDGATILSSVQKTNRLVVVEEGPRTGGWAAEVLATVAQEGLGDIDDIRRLTTPDHPIPYSPALEDAFIPGAEAIVAEVRSL
jgi:acetoin:2,6-dichlorophenolindophenol oxidoreductase subunit beta